ncbi:MAG: putative DNA binding domain-containing protein [Elusimicrobia bacterium]|nr:putative DNA binding domain-containing protein [Elusimicrobiota bacterium]
MGLRSEKKSSKNSADILMLIRQGESQTVEFKQSFGREAIETLCAFANTNGGSLLVGVDDKGVVTGVQGVKSALREWANQVSQGTNGLHPSIQPIAVKGKTVIVIQVEERRVKPVMCHGRPFIRSGSTTRQMGLEEITRSALSNAGVTWDAVPEIRASLDDISMPKVKSFIEAANREKRRSIPAGTSPTELLEKLEMVVKGKPTRAAILLFGKNPQRFYSQAMLKIGRFRGETLIVDDRRIDGTLFDQVEGAMGYFREKLDTRFVMTGRPERDVIWEYPLKALREAVTNAICHRDYMSTRDTEVRIYDRELMVWNDGGLPPTLSIQALKQKHPSVPRNKQIAEIFYYAGMIEAWGGGTKMILDESTTAGLPEPVFEQVQGFRVTFKKATEQVPHKHRTSTGQVADKHRASSGQVADNLKLLTFCQSPKRIRQIMTHMGLHHRDTFTANHLRPLLKKGYLAMTDPQSPRSPKQRYVITEKGAALLEK